MPESEKSDVSIEGLMGEPYGVDAAEEQLTTEEHLVDEEVDDSVTEAVLEGAGLLEVHQNALRDEIEWKAIDFALTHQPPRNPALADGFEEVRAKAKMLASTIVALVPPGVERTEALTALRQTTMWAIAGQALHQEEALRRIRVHDSGLDDIVSLDPQGEEPDPDGVGPFPTENDLAHVAEEALSEEGHRGPDWQPPGIERPVNLVEVPEDG